MRNYSLQANRPYDWLSRHTSGVGTLRTSRNSGVTSACGGKADIDGRTFDVAF